jgi:hypothetical protein
LYTWKLELVFPGDFVPIIIEPAGAVDKSLPPGFRLITDARLGNHIYSEWGSVYHTADDAALGLAPFDFFFCTDIADAYHTAAFAGCGQGIVTEQMTWIDQHGRPHRRPQLFLGCSPRTCTGACDKSLSGICMNGFIFRFACCQFGKATEHGPLNAYILSLIRHGASLTPTLALRAWVDDILGSIRAKRHRLCTGFEGGCPDCAENFAALSVAYQSFLSLCRQLGITLSPGKGFPLAQSGEFTGLCLNTVNGTITAPPQKAGRHLGCPASAKGGG